MLTHTFVRRAGFLVVLIAGVGCAGTAFAAEKTAKKGTGTSLRSEPVPKIPRELAMKPLPTYRIAPPDILQIEVTCAKAAQDEQSQPPNISDKETPPGGAENESGNVGVIVLKADSSAQGNDKGKQANNTTGQITVASDGSSDDATFSSTKVGSGTLTITGTSTYTGTTTTVTGGGGDGTAHWDLYKGAGGPANEANSTATVNAGTLLISGGGTIETGAQAKMPGRIVVKATPRISSVDSSTGQYLVGPDGTINMRQYGMVQVTGKTVAEIKAALEKHLSKYMESPEVWVNVLGYNSQVFYIITDGAGYGDNVRRIPITGNETVLDAVACVGGLSQLSSKKIWISRPSPTNSKKGTILTIDYAAITQQGATETNYQIMPGDRIFIAGDRVTALNNSLGKVTAPIERMMGVISLGASTYRNVKQLFDENEDKQEAPQGEW